MIKTEEEALRYIHSRTRFGSQKSLIRIGRLMERLQNPQEQLRFVHVAGTRLYLDDDKRDFGGGGIPYRALHLAVFGRL